MTQPTLAVAAAEGSRLSQPMMLSPGRGTTYIHASPGQRIILSDPQLPGQPARLTLSRSGNNLVAGLPGEDEPRLVIYDYFTHDAQLQGIAADGTARDWVTADSTETGDMEDGAQAFALLSSDSDNSAPLYIPQHDGGMWPAMAAFAGLLGLGGIVLAMQNQHSGPGESAPSAPTIDQASDNSGIYTGVLADGGLTDDARPQLGGTGSSPGELITVSADGVVIGSATVDANGRWTLSPEVPLAHGSHVFTATATSATGLVSLASATFTLHVDLIAPARPQVASVDDDSGLIAGPLANGTATDDSRPLFTGSAEPGSLVVFMLDGAQVGSALADADGSWQWQPVAALPDGEHRFTAQATDPAGNSGLPSLPFTFTVDTVAPVNNGIAAITDAVGNAPENVITSGITNDNRPSLSGSGEPGALVLLHDGDTLIASFRVDADGNWTWQPDEALKDGEHRFSLSHRDAAGNTSAPSVPVSLTVDTVPPTAPRVIAVLDNVAGGVENGAALADGAPTNDSRPLFTGSAEPGAIITLMIDGMVQASLRVAEDGQWRWQPVAALPDGEHRFTALATDPAGNSGLPSLPFTFTVDTVAPVNNGIAAITDAVGNAPENVITSGITNDNRPSFSGSGEPGALVLLHDGDALLGSFKVDADGNWSGQPDAVLKDGSYVLTVSHRDAAGNLSPASTPIAFEVDTLAPSVPQITAVLDNVAGGVENGNPLTQGAATNDNNPWITGQSEPATLIQLFNTNGELIGSTLTDAAGNWSLQAEKTLIDGTHSFSVQATDIAGNVSALSSPFDIVVDTVNPINAGQSVGSIDPAMIWNGSITNDPQPQLSGSGESGTLLTIYQNAQAVASFVVGATGQWSWQPPVALAEGVWSYSVNYTDNAGNESGISPVTTFTVDTSPPNARAIVDSIGKDSASLGNNSDFATRDGSAGRLITGSLTAPLAVGEKVQISFDNGRSWQDVVLAKGGWYALDKSSYSSSWVIQTRVIDSVMNATLEQKNVVLDTIPPTAPELSWTGKLLTITHPAGLMAGDMLQLLMDGKSLQLVLTAADIAAGYTTYPWNAASVGNTQEIRAAYIDYVGNASPWAQLKQTPESVVTEDFSGQSRRNINTGDVFEFAQFTLRADQVQNEGGFVSRFGDQNQGGVGRPPDSMALEFSGRTTMNLQVKNDQKFNFISMTVGDLNGSESMQAIFYDQAGNEVYRATRTGADGRITTIEFELPYGTVFSAVTLSTQSGTYIWIDDLHFSQLEYATSNPPFENEQLINESATWFGAQTHDSFSFADVSLLSDASFSLAGMGGTDTFVLTGMQQTLDLSLVGNKISSVEIFDITGSGNNTLNLSVNEVLNLGAQDLFIAGDKSVQLMVKGNTGDVVNLSDLLPDDVDTGNWNLGGNISIGGVNYNVYQHSGFDAELLVQQDVSVNLNNH